MSAVPNKQYEDLEASTTVYVTKEHADAHYVKANCFLLEIRGKYYYGEELGKFIEIKDWEYRRILNWPYLVYFTTALRKHVDWREANRKGTTLTFSEALAHSRRSLAHLCAAVVKTKMNDNCEDTASRKRERWIRLAKITLITVAVTALAAFVAAYDSSAPNQARSSEAARSPEIRRAIPVEPEIRRAIPVQPEIRKAIPVQTDRTRRDL